MNVTSSIFINCMQRFVELMPTVLKVKQSRNRPGVAQRVPGSLGSQISMTFGT